MVTPCYSSYIIFWITRCVRVILLGLGRIAFITLLERKALGISQHRQGPNKIRLRGLLQPVFDGVKLLLKNLLILDYSQVVLFVVRPILLLVVFILVWILIPLKGIRIQTKHTRLIFFSLIGVIAYFIILTGLSSASKFSKLGGLRGILQRLSFEVALILIFIVILFQNKRFMFTGDFYYSEIRIIWVLIWVLISLLESNRAPFDLLEGERELIRGFNIEIGSLTFVFLFLREYGIIIVISLIGRISVLKGSPGFLLMFVFMLLFVRRCFPRLRYDTIMIFIWHTILPVAVILTITYYFT